MDLGKTNTFLRPRRFRGPERPRLILHGVLFGKRTGGPPAAKGGAGDFFLVIWAAPIYNVSIPLGKGLRMDKVREGRPPRAACEG
jgi:hypothetical protein